MRRAEGRSSLAQCSRSFERHHLVAPASQKSVDERDGFAITRSFSRKRLGCTRRATASGQLMAEDFRKEFGASKEDDGTTYVLFIPLIFKIILDIVGFRIPSYRCSA